MLKSHSSSDVSRSEGPAALAALTVEKAGAGQVDDWMTDKKNRTEAL